MNLLEELEINQELLSKTEVRLTMPIKPKHLQPYGLLHGGLNAVLAESAASLGANLYCQPDQFPVGLDITTHHLKAAQAAKNSKTASTNEVKIEKIAKKNDDKKEADKK